MLIREKRRRIFVVHVLNTRFPGPMVLTCHPCSLARAYSKKRATSPKLQETLPPFSTATSPRLIHGIFIVTGRHADEQLEAVFAPFERAR
jgi:hypothetical protein